MNAHDYTQFINKMEDENGIRFNWNQWPTSKEDFQKLITPLGCLYTPLKEKEPFPHSEPIYCNKTSCKAFLNPYCTVDYISKLWICIFCKTKNKFAPEYAMISPQNLPAALCSQFDTLEYTLPNIKSTLPNIFLYVIDTCIDPEEMDSLTKTLISSLSMLPKNALVGLITFGSRVEIYELNYDGISTVYTFQGTKDYEINKMQNLIGIGKFNVHKVEKDSSGALLPSRFLLPLSECKENLITQIDNVKINPYRVEEKKRALRSTGVALSLAISLLEGMFCHTGARIMMFIGGPCTLGPGKIAAEEIENVIRTHHTIFKGDCNLSNKAVKYYGELAERAASNGHVIDLYTCSDNQTGLYEMKCCPHLTGGYVIMGDTFSSRLFSQSFEKVFSINSQNEYEMAFNGTLEVKTSSDLKIAGAIGHCMSLEKKNDSVAQNEIGVGGTCMWKFCSLDPSATVAIYFDIAIKKPVDVDNSPPEYPGYIQFITHYQHCSGLKKIRVTTVARNWTNVSTDIKCISRSFDQEAAIALTAKLACYKADMEELVSVRNWIDQNLFRLFERFANFTKDMPNSFNYPENFARFPEFLFHLRRSPLIEVSNNSPDETSYNRYYLYREDLNNSLLMIQPTLISYGINEETMIVLLDNTSIKPDRILLMDTFFHIVIFHGETIARWRKDGYQNQPEYANFKQLLEAPIDDANDLLITRFPLPRYIDCDQNGSQARFLLSKVNPSKTHFNNYGEQDSTTVLTDDISFQKFMDHFIKVMISSTYREA